MRAQLLVSLLTAAALLLLTSPAQPRTWHILPDGSGDAPTIQAGVDSAAVGDTVKVACGTYFEHSIENMKSGIILRSETGHPSCATIDAQFQGRIFFISDTDNSTTIEGLTFVHGDGRDTWNRGGAMYLWTSGPVIRHCVFRDNIAGDSGGAINHYYGYPLIEDCVFEGNSTGLRGGALYFFISNDALIRNCLFLRNHSDIYGGAVAFWGTDNRVENCTFYGNYAEVSGGGAVYSTNFSNPVFTTTIITGTVEGGAVCHCDASDSPVFACTDIFGNVGGDWLGYISGQANINGNFSADPLFCDPGSGDFTLAADSPCLPGNHPYGWDCGLIGALGQGCGPVALQPSTWAVIKARYR